MVLLWMTSPEQRAFHEKKITRMLKNRTGTEFDDDDVRESRGGCLCVESTVYSGASTFIFGRDPRVASLFLVGSERLYIWFRR